MPRSLWRLSGALMLLSLLLFPLAVSAHERAHESTPAGDYEVEYGWLNEPPIAGQPNAVVINLTQAPTEDHASHSAKINIVAPTDDATVQGDQVSVEVAFEGLDEESDAHWHLYVDDQMISMIPLDQPHVTVSGLSNGRHALRVALAASDHQDVGEPAMAHITVAGAADSGSPKVEGVEHLAEHEHTHTAFVDVDVSGLKVEVVYGPESKVLALQPLGEDTPGQFIAPLTPTRAGQYTLRLTGQIGASKIENIEVQPEEVADAHVVQFPQAAEAELADQLAAAKAQASSAQVMAIVGIVLGVIGIGVGAFAFSKRK